MGILLKNADFIDPVDLTAHPLDVLVEDGRILQMGENLPPRDHEVLDLTGLLLCPGLIDMHVHLRDPGQTQKEDIFTGTHAAAAGGFTTVCCMPNTNPVADTPEVLRYILEKAEEADASRVLPIGAVTAGEKGEALTDFGALSRAGAIAFSDDGKPVSSAKRMRDALLLAKTLGKAVIAHCEDAELVQNFAVNEGKISEELGLPGRPAIAEELMVLRDTALAEETGGHVHIAHVSTKRSAQIIREAKLRGFPVTAETCPQYFLLTEDEILRQGTLARVNPPLRTEEDRAGILEAVLDGTLDCIVTDHAPHTAAEKSRPLPDAPSGMIGLETSLAASFTALCVPGYLSAPELIARMTAAPAEILGLSIARHPGDVADLMAFDPTETWVVDPEKFRSRARNTPFAGKKLSGRVKLTMRGGSIIYREL